MLPIPNDALTLAIDVGTSSVRALILNQDGEALENVFAQERYQADTTADGGVTFDADQMVQRVLTCIETVLQAAGAAVSRVRAVAMDTLVSNLVGVSGEGQPVTPVYTWADTRGSDMIGKLRQRLEQNGLSPESYIQATGCRLHTSFWPLRLLWLAEQEQFKRVAYWMSIGEYVYFRLFGQRRVSLSVASWTGLLNRHRLNWDDRVLEAVGIRREQLSELSGEPLTGMLSKWPELQGARWFPAIGDGVASNIGAGCTVPGFVALSVGTSGALRVVVPGTPEKVPDGLFAYRVDARRTLVGGSLSNAGNLYAWMQGLLKFPDNLEKEIAIMQPDSHGLTILPFLAGERAPGWNPAAESVFVGMRLHTTPAQMVCAGLEAIAYRFGQVAERLGPLLPPQFACVASGAAILNSPTWMQIMADVLNAPVYATVDHETTIRGAVYLATGHEPEPRLSQRYDPDPGRHAVYSVAMDRQKALYQRMFGSG